MFKVLTAKIEIQSSVSWYNISMVDPNAEQSNKNKK